jgi:regulator of sigma E protease
LRLIGLQEKKFTNNTVNHYKLERQNFMVILSTILYFIITIFIIVMVHEIGHFIAAKLSGMRVDRFSLGFPPRLFGKKIGETDYCISALPIGGYVKVAGMIDESNDTEFLNKPPEPWEFRSKSIPKKIFTLANGVLMNILLSILIFWGIKYFQTDVVWKTTDIGTITKHSVADSIGFMTGDRILKINGASVQTWNQIESQIVISQISDDVPVLVDRSGEEVTLSIPKNTIKETDTYFLFYPKDIFVKIFNVQPASAAERAGILKNDIIKTIDSNEVHTNIDAISLIQMNAGREISMVLLRDSNLVELNVTPDSVTKMIGIQLNTFYDGPKEERHLGLFESFGAGIKLAYSTTIMFFKSIWFIIDGKVEFSKAIGGPIKIAELATQSASMGVVSFFSFIGMLSLTLAIINILPFPALDGGHIMFVIYEAIFKKEFPLKARMIIQQTGFYILMLFMVYVIYNDIFR